MRESFEPLGSSFHQVPRWLWASLLQLRASLRQNLGMGLMALSLSTVLWVVVINEQNPPKTAMLPHAISVQPVNVPADMDIIGDLGTVSLTVTAPLDIWEGLDPSGFAVVADFSAVVGEGQVEVPVVAHAKDNRVRILGVVPPTMQVYLGPLRRQLVPVQVNLQEALPFGYALGEPIVSTEGAVVLGPEAKVSAVDAAVADVNLSEARATIRQSFRLTPRTARGYQVEGVTLEPSWVVVEIAIQRQLSYQSVPVVPQTQGQVASGYWVRSLVAEPASVAMAGPRVVLDGVSYLRTQPIDLDKATQSLTRAVGLVLPPEVGLVDVATVLVNVQVEPIAGNAVLYLAPEFRGVAPALQARASVSTLEVWVSGAGPTLQRLNPNQVAVIVDAGGLGPGTYLLRPTVRLPAGIELYRVEPELIEVTVR